MKRKEQDAVERRLCALFGDPLSMDAAELDDAYRDLGGPAEPLKQVREVAKRVAAEYYRKNQPLPNNLRLALQAMDADRGIDEVPTSKLEGIIARALSPFRGPVDQVAFSYRDLSEKSERDKRVLGELEDEIKRDWSGGEDPDGGPKRK